jgi:hypothetical protein
MTPLDLLAIAIRGSALALELQGQKHTSGALFLLADGVEGGRNVDAHMATVAEKLKDRDAIDDDFADVEARIRAESEAGRAG